MVGGRSWQVLLGLLALVALLPSAVFGAHPADADAAPGARAARALPDLTVTTLKIGGAGNPEHAVVTPDGHVEGLVAHVEIKNIGHGPARSTTAQIVGVYEKSKTLLDLVEIHKLAPRQAQKATVELTGPYTTVGFMKISVIANSTLVSPVRERTRKNNTLTRGHIAVIPQVWKVDEWSTVDKQPGGSLQESFASSAMRFHFVAYVRGDEAFEYNVSGGVNGRISGNEGGICNVEGSGFTSHTPWSSKSGVFISQKLTRYKAFVFASADEPWSLTVTCIGGSAHKRRKGKIP